MGVKDFKKNCILYLLSKSVEKIEYLKLILACLCSSTSEILSISHQTIILWTILAFNSFIPDGNKRLCILRQSSSWKMEVCLSLYGVLISPIMKGLIRHMFMATLSETIKNKIKSSSLLTYILSLLFSVYITWCYIFALSL